MSSSILYRAELWRLGVKTARWLPQSICTSLAQSVAELYQLCNPRRRQVVTQNLVPVLNGDTAAAAHTARRLYRQFGRKLAHLWRYEGGSPLDSFFTNHTGWEHFEATKKEGRGILILTAHLGNWEFGAPLLTHRGIELFVVTLDEPHSPLTEMRRKSRERFGIQTIVIGRDPFAFVEVIRKLESGAAVALLIDRPSPHTAVQVNLFGRPFNASSAPAELARATGCALIPVYLPFVQGGYEAHVLPPIPYARQALRQPEARQALTQQIMRAFEPAIRHHPDQWYHFVPIWQKS